jgi:hypothetical protein
MVCKASRKRRSLSKRDTSRRKQQFLGVIKIKAQANRDSACDVSPRMGRLSIFQSI